MPTRGKRNSPAWWLGLEAQKDEKVEMDRVTLYQGDCMNTMAQIADGSVDGLIIDPPYSSGGTFSTQRKAERGKSI